jgi:cell division septation protein DedD
MRENIRLRQPGFEVVFDARKVCAVLLVAAVLMGATFVLGLAVGRRAGLAAAQPSAAQTDVLSRLDEPLAGREEPPPELNAHQALTDSRPFEKTLPVAPSGSSVVASPASSTYAEVLVPPSIPAAPPVAATAPPAAAVLPASPPVAVAAPEPAEDAHPAETAQRRPDPVPAQVAHAKATPAFTIQIGSTPRRADAERLAKRFAASRVVAADVPGKGRWYRVQIGAFESREAAQRRLASLSRDGVQGIVTAAR